MSDMTTPRFATWYVYKPFASIRLLRLARSSDQSLHGKLETFTLGDQHCPEFITLSYVWGEPRRTRTIQVDGRPLPVLDNVFPILEALCDYPRFRDDHWVWIDSICINLEDEHERAQQVQLMGRIYEQSTRTIVWLGPGSVDTDKAMDFFHELVAAIAGNPRSDSTVLPPSAWQSTTWDSVEVFFRQPWWTRVWTLQEFVLPSSLELHCGEKAMAHDVFYEVMQALYFCHSIGIGRGVAWGTGWGRRRMRKVFAEYPKNRVSLLSLLAYTGDYECVDPRDRIYSLLGLARDRDRAVVGVPTYNPKNTIQAVYTDFVINFIDVFDSLDVICFAPLFRLNTDSKGAGIPRWPSWLPDWRAKVRPRVVPLMVSQPGRDHIGCFRPLPWPEIERQGSMPIFSASGSTQPHTHHNVSAQTLTCRGVYLGKIDGIATRSRGDDRNREPTESNQVQSTSPANAKGMGLPPGASEADLATDIVRTLTINRYSRYLESTFPAESVRIELYQLSLLIPNMSEEEDKSDTTYTVEWIRSNEEFMIRGRRLLDICRGIPLELEKKAPTTFLLPERLMETMGGRENCFDMAFATLSDGYLALVPTGSMKGDDVWVLQGCSVPVALRKQDEDDLYTLVGECYVHNFMDGEALSGSHRVEDVVIG